MYESDLQCEARHTSSDAAKRRAPNTAHVPPTMKQVRTAILEVMMGTHVGSVCCVYAEAAHKMGASGMS